MTRNAPAHLSPEAAELWAEVMAAYPLEAHRRAILERALEAHDRMREAQAVIKADGFTVEGRFGPKLHPAHAIERDSRLGFLRCVHALGLDGGGPDLRYSSGKHRNKRTPTEPPNPPDEKGRVRPRLMDLERTFTE